MKKPLSAIMACGAMFAAMTLMAATEKVGAYTWTYEITDGEAAIYGTSSGGSSTPCVSPAPTDAVKIPSKLGGCPVVGIGDHAFYDCTGLTRVTIPASVTSIDRAPFRSCSGLKSISVETGNPSFKSVSGLVLTKDGKTLVAGVNGKVKIPAGVTTILSYAFYGLDNLTSVTIPSSVTSIGAYAFAWCSSLTGVTIPKGVTSIDDFAFSNCHALKSVTVPDGVTIFRQRAFDSCVQLKSVTIPASMWSIGYEAFDHCEELSDVYCYADPLDLEWDDPSRDFKSDKSTKIHVLAEHLSAYKSKFGSNVNATFVGDLDSFLTVKFNANGGAAAETTRKVKKGKAVGTLPKATKKGYTFKGWYTAKSGGSKISASTKVAKNVTYYAQWKANKYKIKFNRNGGMGRMKSQSATYGKSVTLRANAFKRPKYKFKGWAKTKTGKVAYKNKSKVKNLTALDGKTVTLYAVWRKS